MRHAKLHTFYVDECLDSDHFIKPLRKSDLQVVRHREILEKGVPDEIWIKAVSDEGYFAFTEDYEIAQNTSQTGFVMDNQLGLFIVRSKNSTHSEKGQLVVQNKPKLLRFIEKNSRPYIATITRSGVHGRRPINRKWGQRCPET